jgi:hypothetical protein
LTYFLFDACRPPKKVDPDEELENILFQNDDVEARDDEEVQKEELVTLGTTPSPAPLPGDFPFSPPARGGNPMILNSPFQRESALDSSPPGAGPGAYVLLFHRIEFTHEPGRKASPISPREAFRRRRARSLSCPEKDPNLLISEA